MLVKARVIPNSRVSSIERMDDGSYRIKVTEKAMDGRANAAVIVALSLRFNVRKSNVSIVKGAASRDKMIEITGVT